MANPKKATNSKQVTKGNKEVLRKKKSKQRKSRLNRTKILEIKSKILGCKKNADKLFKTFDDKDEVEHGYSIRELSMSLYPDYVRTGEDGNDEPTLEGIILTKAAIRHWRKKILEGNPKKMVIVPFSQATSDGHIYYNMKTKSDFYNVVEFSERVVNGIKKMLREFLKILDMRASDKDEINEQYRQEIRETILALDQAAAAKRRKRLNRS